MSDMTTKTNTDKKTFADPDSMLRFVAAPELIEAVLPCKSIELLNAKPQRSTKFKIIIAILVVFGIALCLAFLNFRSPDIDPQTR